MYDFRRITLFCLEKRLSKHKMTIFFKNVGGGHGPFGHPPATPMPSCTTISINALNKSVNHNHI